MTDSLAFLLVLMFGSSTWLTINAVWVELSLYTNRLPEKWSLPSYLAAFIQMACLLTLAYSVAQRHTRLNANKGPIILALLIFTSLCMLSLAFFWDHTVYISGVEHSVTMITLTFFMAFVCAASNVLFLPYLAAYRPAYMNAYFIGMSFSSLVPSILKLVQGVGNYTCVPVPTSNNISKFEDIETEPAFSARIYNLIIFAWMCAATLSFAILHWTVGQIDNNRSSNEHTKIVSTRSEQMTEKCSNNANLSPKSDEQQETDEQHAVFDGEQQSKPVMTSIKSTKSRYWTLIAFLAFTSAQMNTIVPSIQSYATLSYSLLTYHLALTLSNLSHPAANFLPLWIKPSSMLILVALVVACTAGTLFIFLLALQSPEPMFRSSIPLLGSALSIVISVLTGFLHSYLRTHITSLVRREQQKENAESALFWCGFFMQIGSFLGACAMFPLVNYTTIFQKRDRCAI